MVPLIPLMMLPIAVAAGSWRRRLTVALGAIGVGIEVVGQLVPYGLYYGAIVPQLAERMGICRCVPAPSQATRAIQSDSSHSHRSAAFDTMRLASSGFSCISHSGKAVAEQARIHVVPQEVSRV